LLQLSLIFQFFTGLSFLNAGPQFSASKFDKFLGKFGKFRGLPRQHRWNSVAHHGYRGEILQAD